MDTLRLHSHLVLPVGLIVFGGGTMVWLIRSEAAPEAGNTPARVTTVVVMVIEPQATQVPVVGYGTVRPKNQAQVVPQVSGELIYTHPDLAQGKIIAKGELLFELAPSVFEIRIRQAEAEVRGLEAVLARHDLEIANIGARIAIAEKLCAVDEGNYTTSKRLLEEDDVGTQRGLDAVYQKYLRQQDALVSLMNHAATLPYVKLEIQAKADAARAKLSQALHDLESTKISCPFTARVESVGAYRSQMVTAHFSIATLTDVEAFEIPIGIDPRDLRWLDRAVQPRALERNTGEQGPEVKIRWSLPDQDAEWRGHVARFERIDEETRTARMIVEVRNHDVPPSEGTGQHESGTMPSMGMHCRVELPTKLLNRALVIPRHAIHDGRWVYVFEPIGPDIAPGLGRLGRREITVLRTVGDAVLVDYEGRNVTHVCELEPGDRLVTSPLAAPIVGMKVALHKERTEAIIDRNNSEPAESPELVLGAWQENQWADIGMRSAVDSFEMIMTTTDSARNPGRDLNVPDEMPQRDPLPRPRFGRREE